MPTRTIFTVSATWWQGQRKLSASVKELWFEKFGIRIFEGYGATETAPVIAVNTPMAYRSGTVGQILPGIETKLIPVPGIDAGGILHVKGANVMSGYLRSERPGFLEKPSSDAGEWDGTIRGILSPLMMRDLSA
jgi:acyl-[acyl-carrier-protein]-phospholipid O-acyltransferase / long-chain-fatty-acid--[acyl-carrier-protein] ligase